MTNEEMALAIQQGDKSLIAPLWEQLRRLIGMHAGRCFNRMQGRCAAAGVTEEDLIQTGFFAMLDAVRAYDPASGYKLTAFLRYPLQNRFNALLGLRTVRAQKDPLNGCDSLDEPLGGEGDDFTRSDVLPDENAQQPFEDVIESEWRRSLRIVEDEAINKHLTEGEAAAVRGAFFEGLRLQPIADQLGVSRERVRQLQYNGLRRLRTGDASKRLMPFMYAEYGALGLRGTGLSAFRYGGSSTERAVETLERRRERQEQQERVSRYSSMTLEELKAERDRLHRQIEDRWRARLNFDPSEISEEGGEAIG
ncbi:RNA polymerase sigma factor RpoS [anaerobic digester metagenome]